MEKNNRFKNKRVKSMIINSSLNQNISNLWKSSKVHTMDSNPIKSMKTGQVYRQKTQENHPGPSGFGVPLLTKRPWRRNCWDPAWHLRSGRIANKNKDFQQYHSLNGGSPWPETSLLAGLVVSWPPNFCWLGPCHFQKLHYRLWNCQELFV